VSRLRNTIVRAFADLDALGCSWAVVGGLAVSAHANPRTTRDLDVAVSVEGDTQAEQLVRALLARGYAVEGAVEHTARERLATVRLRPPIEGAAIVDLLFASSGLEPEIVAAATVLELVPGVRVPVATVGHLLAMKVLARDDRNRPQDWDDIRALLVEASASDIEVARDSLREIERRGFGREKALVAEFEALRRELGSGD
jgi:ActR/RegA family two-component response regulator